MARARARAPAEEDQASRRRRALADADTAAADRLPQGPRSAGTPGARRQTAQGVAPTGAAEVQWLQRTVGNHAVTLHLQRSEAPGPAPTTGRPLGIVVQRKPAPNVIRIPTIYSFSEPASAEGKQKILHREGIAPLERAVKTVALAATPAQARRLRERGQDLQSFCNALQEWTLHPSLDPDFKGRVDDAKDRLADGEVILSVLADPKAALEEARHNVSQVPARIDAAMTGAIRDPAEQTTLDNARKSLTEALNELSGHPTAAQESDARGRLGTVATSLQGVSVLSRMLLGDSAQVLLRERLRLAALVDKKKASIDNVREAWQAALDDFRTAERVLGQVPTTGDQTPMAPAAARPELPHEEKDLGPAERWSRISASLGTIAGGREALETITKYGVKVSFVSKGGGVFSSEENTIVLDASWSLKDNALTIVHEANHARYYHEGKSGNARIDTLSRPDYINTMIEEEAEGVVREIEAKADFKAAGVKVPGADRLERIYEAAARTAMAAAKRKDKAISDDDLQARGREAGKNAVIREFKSGRVITSNTLEPYTVYYGKGWDKAHGK